MKHLYILNDKEPFIHNDPTPEDLALTNNGDLQIFRFVPGSLRGEIQQYNPNSKHYVPWDPVETGIIKSDGNGNLYHAPP